MRWPWSRKQRETFDSPPRPIVELFAEMYSREGTTVTRNNALSVPAVRRGRNLICSVATMPLEQHGPDGAMVASALLRQIDPDVPNVVTISQTVEDLLFDGISWWLVTARDFAGFPVAARHLDVSTVSVDPPQGRSSAPLPSGVDPRGGVVWVDGNPVSGSEVIRFDSPNPAVLKHAGREIRRAIALERAAVMYADDPRPADYFEPADGADEVSDDDVTDILAKWKSSRKLRSTAYVPAALKYHTVDSPAPRDLQLVELQRQVNLDISNALGIDPEDLGISTTSRTYSNDVDRRRNKLNEVLSPYMRAITDRLGMGDVTRRGYTVRFNTSEYLLPNPTSRWANYQTAVDMGAMTVEEVREAEGMPPLPPGAARDARPAPDDNEDTGDTGDSGDEPEVDTVNADRPATMTFDDDRGLTFVNVPVETFSVNREGRVIEGVALPYGQLAHKGGLSFRFERGSLQWDAESPGRVKLLRDHDYTQPIGRAIQLRDTPAGVLARFKVARGAEGDRALELAEDGVLDGFSVGVDFDARADTVPDPKNKGALLVRRADWRETSLTAMPSFDNARVTSVAASRTTGGGHVADTDTDQTTEPPAAPDQTGLSLDEKQVTALLSRPGAIQALVATQQPANEPDTTPEGGLTLSAEQVDGLIRSGGLSTLLGLPAPAAGDDGERPTPVDPTRRVDLSVREPAPYRFDRDGNLLPGSHDFSSDLIFAGRDHDQAAYERAMSFVQAQFAVQTTDVNEVNPDIQRPDMFVDQLDYEYPLWASINRGSIGSVTPFVVPKFNTASGLVGDHTEATEPTSGSYTVTSQTITPTAISGKAEITRETWDQGGNPQVSALVWRQMVREWNEELESAAATFLNTLTAATDIAITTAAADDALASEWNAAMAELQFVRGGHRFSMFGVHIDLYKAFVDAVDTSGRPLYPIINPRNADGMASSRFGQLDLGGVTAVPSWALGASGAVSANSWLFNPEDVHGWASPPQRLQFEYQVKSVEIGIWGYKALANTRIDGVRQVTYDPTV